MFVLFSEYSLMFQGLLIHMFVFLTVEEWKMYTFPEYLKGNLYISYKSKQQVQTKSSFISTWIMQI